MIKETMKIANHLSLGEVKMRMQMSGVFPRVLKWLVIYNAIVDPRPISEIARHTGLSECTVRRVIEDYNSGGPESLSYSPGDVPPPRNN